MRKIIVLAGLSIALPFAAAAAQDLPKWPTAAACSPGDDACPAFESEYRGQVSGVWNTLPPDIRGKCLEDTARIEPSYRLLYDCLANEMQAFTKNQLRNPEDGEVVQLTPPAESPPSPPVAAQPGVPASSGPAPAQPARPTESEPAPPGTPPRQ